MTIRDLLGNDLVLNPPPDSFVSLVGASTLPVSIGCLLVENDPSLPTMQVAGTLSWNDGTQPVVFTGAGTVAASDTRSLFAGNYLLTITAHNYRAPLADTAAVTIGFTVRPEAKEAVPPRIIYGPILPRDYGAPNADQWEFNTSSDIQILESSLKMLFLTSVGERIMEPEYGTNIRRILFEANIAGIDAAIQEEITVATQRWEPRAALQTLSVVRTSERSAVVNAIFVSKLTQQRFNTVFNFTQ